MEHFILFIVLGCIIGILSGIFGIGGGLILTPLLMLMGTSPVVAITISLFYTMGTSISGLVGHFKMKNTNLKNSLILGVSGVIGTQAAQPLVFWSEKMNFDDTVIPLFYIVLLLYFAYSMLKKEKNQGKNIKPILNKPVLALIIIGFIGGFVSSALGVGGGFIIVPILISMFGMDAKKAVGTSIGGVMIIVAAGFAGYAFNTHFNWKMAIFLLLGGFVGAQVGVRVTNYFASSEIKILLGWLYVSTFISVAFKLFNENLVGLCIVGVYTLFLMIKISIRFISKEKIQGT